MKMEEIKNNIIEAKYLNILSESEVIIRELKKDFKLKFLLDDLEKETKIRKVNLVFGLNDSPSDFKGKVDYTSKNIYIEVNSNLVDEYIEPIFAHEIGEANYILRSLPVLDRDGIYNPALPRINEIFSHVHIQQMFRLKNVYSLYEKLDELDAGKWIYKDFEN